MHETRKFAEVPSSDVLLFRMRLKYIKDISMFNYEPAAVLLVHVCLLCNDSLLNVSDNLSNVTRPCSYLSLIRALGGDGSNRKPSH